MIDIAEINLPAGARCRRLGMTADTEVRVTNGEHLGVDGAVRIVTARATFPHRRMLKNDRLGLFPMAARAIFVQARHRQSTRRFHDVHAMRIVTLDAVHFSFKDGMVLGKMKFRLRFQMAFETGSGFASGVDDEPVRPARPGHGNMLARRSVAGFATVLPAHLAIFQAQPRMGACRKYPGDIRVTIEARLVTHVGGTLDLQRLNTRAIQRGTGIDQQNQSRRARERHQPRQVTPESQHWIAHLVHKRIGLS